MGQASVNFSMESDEDDETGIMIQNCINSLVHGTSDLPNGDHCSVCLDTWQDIKMSGKHSFKSNYCWSLKYIILF